MNVKLLLASLVCLVCYHSAIAQQDLRGKQPVANAALVVSFYSIGAGTNRNAYDAVMAIIASHNRKYHTNVAYDEVRWGREGEHDLCFPRQGAKGFTQLVRLLRKKCAGYQHVRTSVNIPCREGR